jgi:hypothetical protein
VKALYLERARGFEPPTPTFRKVLLCLTGAIRSHPTPPHPCWMLSHPTQPWVCESSSVVERYWRRMLCSRSWAGRRLTWDAFNRIKERTPLLTPKLRLPHRELQALAVL